MEFRRSMRHWADPIRTVALLSGWDKVPLPNLCPRIVSRVPPNVGPQCGENYSIPTLVFINIIFYNYDDPKKQVTSVSLHQTWSKYDQGEAVGQTRWNSQVCMQTGSCWNWASPRCEVENESKIGVLKLLKWSCLNSVYRTVVTQKNRFHSTIKSRPLAFGYRGTVGPL